MHEKTTRRFNSANTTFYEFFHVLLHEEYSYEYVLNITNVF